jgi:type IV pilus assembly protein PilA
MISKERNMSLQQQKGFTLIELMIVIAIIGILAALALPAYQTYAKKAKFSEVVMATTAVKSAIDICYQTKGDLTKCDANATDGSQAVINAKDNADTGDHVAEVLVTDDTAIITAKGAAPVDGAHYVLVPTPDNGALSWDLDITLSTCLAAGLCDER